MPDDNKPLFTQDLIDRLQREFRDNDLDVQQRLLLETTPSSAGTHSGPMFYDGEAFSRDLDPGTLAYWKRAIASKSVISQELLTSVGSINARAVMVAMQEDDRRWAYDPKQQVYTTLMRKKPLNNRGVLTYLAKKAREM